MQKWLIVKLVVQFPKVIWLNELSDHANQCQNWHEILIWLMHFTKLTNIDFFRILWWRWNTFRTCLRRSQLLLTVRVVTIPRMPITLLPQLTPTHQVEFIGLDKKNFQHKIVNIFLPIMLSICFGCSKEPSHWDGSFEFPQHMFCLRNKKIFFGTHW